MNYFSTEVVEQAVDETFTNLEFTNSLRSTNEKVFFDGVTGQCKMESGLVLGNFEVRGELINSVLDDLVKNIEIGSVVSTDYQTPASASLYPVGDGLYKLDLSLQQGNPGVNGAQGQAGPQGETGPQGPQGPAGQDGDAVTISETVAVTTLNPGSSATASIAYIDGENYLSLGIPRGDKGDKGDRGSDGSDGARGPKGEKGDTGDTGPPGDTTAATASAVAAAASATAAVGAAAAASTSATAASASAAAAASSAASAATDAATATQRTQFMSTTTFPMATTFNSDLNVSNGVSNKITMDSFSGNITSSGKVEAGRFVASGKIDAVDDITTDAKVVCTEVNANNTKTGTLYCSAFEQNVSLDPMVFNSEATFNGATTVNGDFSVVNNDPFLITSFNVSRDTATTRINSAQILLGPTPAEGVGTSAVTLNGSLSSTGSLNAVSVYASTGFFSGGVYAPNLYLGGPGGGFNQFL
jgi:hypothetical protein